MSQPPQDGTPPHAEPSAAREITSAPAFERDTSRRFAALTPKRQGPIVIVVTLLVTCVVVSLLLREVWYRVQVVKLGYEMNTLARERRNLMEERRKLRLEAAVSTGTERLDEVARGRLGLRPIQPEQILYVRPDARAAR